MILFILTASLTALYTCLVGSSSLLTLWFSVSAEALVLRFLFVLLETDPIGGYVRSGISPLLPVGSTTSLPLVSAFVEFPS